ncbi:MAG: bifunctional hydroxymethylpyrimidine kinase/phosphomethylpyrimidine kinase [Solirubrobacteraceae bacterium]
MDGSRGIPRVLTIAGSDSGGGAGIQADLKAFARCGTYGMTAITAITAQNTREVTAVQPIAPEVIVAQVRAVVDDIGVDAVKIGMLGDEPTILAVQEALDLLPPSTPVVLDPVMVAESGAALLDPAAGGALVERLLPRVAVATPNLLEAAALAGARPDAEPEGLARAVHALGPLAVVVTGGHRDDATDVFFDGERLESIPGERFLDVATHGSGCTHSSALAAHLALGLAPLEAARCARAIAGEAVRHGLRDLGGGAGPVDALELVSRAASERPALCHNPGA